MTPEEIIKNEESYTARYLEEKLNADRKSGKIFQQTAILMIAAAVRWVGGVDGFLELIDQRRLPGKLVNCRCRDIKTAL